MNDKENKEVQNDQAEGVKAAESVTHEQYQTFSVVNSEDKKYYQSKKVRFEKVVRKLS
jgi:hypothetical protein